jgi:hypothetical protein
MDVTAPVDVAGSELITLNDNIRGARRLELASPTLVAVPPLKNENKPPWQIYVSLTGADEAVSGGHVVLNALLSFKDPKDTTKAIARDKINEGSWLFEVDVNAGDDKFILGYVRVSLSGAAAKPAAAASGTNAGADQGSGD